MNRIENKFVNLKNNDEKAFIPYICVGDPDMESTEKLVYILEESGADIIELGIPFSDPLADGPVIQEAGIRSLNNGFKVDKFFECMKNIRKNSQIPIASMVYYSTIFGYGKEKFIKNCVDSEVDGLIIPDLPYEEYDEIISLIEKTDLCLIPLVAVTSNERIPMLVKNAKGFIYCVSSLGVTGERSKFHNTVDEFLKDVKNNTDVPICVGFGISKKEDADRFNKTADGVIVGSALVRMIYESNMNKDKIKNFISSFKK